MGANEALCAYTPSIDPQRIWEHANVDILETFLEAQVEQTHGLKKVFGCSFFFLFFCEVF